MASQAAQDRITGLQSQLSEVQRLAKMYSMPYVGSDGKTPVESATMAGKDKAGKPLSNPDYLPDSAKMYLEESSRIQTQLSQAQQSAETQDAPDTTVHPTGQGGLVSVTTTKNPDQAGAPTVTQIAPDKAQIVNIPGVGVGSVGADNKFNMVWTNQNLTPAEKVQAAYQGYGAYATWLNAQTQSGQLDEKKRQDLWDNAHQQYQDQLDALKVQQAQQAQDETSRYHAAQVDDQNRTTASRFASDMTNAEVSSLKDRVGPDFGADFAGNFGRIGANPSGGQSNIQFKPGDFSVQSPDPVALGQQQFQQMMARISPYASHLASGGAPIQTPPPPQIPGALPATAPTSPQSVDLGTYGATP